MWILAYTICNNSLRKKNNITPGSKPKKMQRYYKVTIVYTLHMLRPIYTWHTIKFKQRRNKLEPCKRIFIDINLGFRKHLFCHYKSI